jgi:hypothetical protein
MKKQLLVYALLIIAFIFYNQFFRVEDERLNEIINILFASFLFLYIGYVAFVAIRKMKKASKK